MTRTQTDAHLSGYLERRGEHANLEDFKKDLARSNNSDGLTHLTERRAELVFEERIAELLHNETKLSAASPRNSGRTSAVLSELDKDRPGRASVLLRPKSDMRELAA